MFPTQHETDSHFSYSACTHITLISQQISLIRKTRQICGPIIMKISMQWKHIPQPKMSQMNHVSLVSLQACYDSIGIFLSIHILSSLFSAVWCDLLKNWVINHLSWICFRFTSFGKGLSQTNQTKPWQITQKYICPCFGHFSTQNKQTIYAVVYSKVIYVPGCRTQ